ncbi:hypothetical protein [Actinomycetospora sp. CA-053990]|uniref:hypothetical protein n=1 Tax=Actinomycetospora sp. CA-053990 TaxID=3239891 RepID=UPI003D944641
MGGASSLLDEQGSPSRRWAELGVVRASELRGRRGRTRGSAPAEEPVVEPVAESAAESVAAPVSGPSRVEAEGSAVLPVMGPLAGVLPGGGLRRGSAVAVCGSTSLLLALLAEASRAGAWCALVGLPDLGIQAAAEAGLDLSRTALVPRPGPRPAAVVAALVDGVDVVVLDTTLPGVRWPAGDRQRLGARVRQRGRCWSPWARRGRGRAPRSSCGPRAARGPGSAATARDGCARDASACAAPPAAVPASRRCRCCCPAPPGSARRTASCRSGRR